MKFKLINLWGVDDIHFIHISIIRGVFDDRKSFNIIILNICLEISFKK